MRSALRIGRGVCGSLQGGRVWSVEGTKGERGCVADPWEGGGVCDRSKGGHRWKRSQGGAGGGDPRGRGWLGGDHNEGRLACRERRVVRLVAKVETLGIEREIPFSLKDDQWRLTSSLLLIINHQKTLTLMTWVAMVQCALVNRISLT